MGERGTEHVLCPLPLRSIWRLMSVDSRYQLGRSIPFTATISPTTEDRSNAMTLDVPSGCCGTMSHGGVGEARADADQY
jgi:hypothetical protein